MRWSLSSKLQGFRIYAYIFIYFAPFFDLILKLCKIKLGILTIEKVRPWDQSSL